MGSLSPVAFDIETSGFDRDAVLTVAGFRNEVGSWLALNTGGRDASADALREQLRVCSANPVKVHVVDCEHALLQAVGDYADERLKDGMYLTAYNGETWNGGFDLPFLRSACLRNGVSWPFDEIAYADTMETMQRFDTGETGDLCGVYDQLVVRKAVTRSRTMGQPSMRGDRASGSRCSSTTSLISNARTHSPLSLVNTSRNLTFR